METKYTLHIEFDLDITTPYAAFLSEAVNTIFDIDPQLLVPLLDRYKIKYALEPIEYTPLKLVE